MLQKFSLHALSTCSLACRFPSTVAVGRTRARSRSVIVWSLSSRLSTGKDLGFLYFRPNALSSSALACRCLPFLGAFFGPPPRIGQQLRIQTPAIEPDPSQYLLIQRHSQSAQLADMSAPHSKMRECASVCIQFVAWELGLGKDCIDEQAACTVERISNDNKKLALRPHRHRNMLSELRLQISMSVLCLSVLFLATLCPMRAMQLCSWKQLHLDFRALLDDPS